MKFASVLDLILYMPIWRLHEQYTARWMIENSFTVLEQQKYDRCITTYEASFIIYKIF